ncbi:histidine phosphatase family protein, partial [Magnetococcales bacterium HHB-1]
MSQQYSTLHIDLLRHGKPEGGDRYRGWQDDPLSPQGWQEMHQAIEKKNFPWTEIITSPLQRCRHFAEKIAQERNIPITIEPRLKELHFGRWEGLTAKEILELDNQLLIQFWKNPLKNPPPEGEDLHQLQKRVTEAWYDILNHKKKQHILLVSHSGV